MTITSKTIKAIYRAITKIVTYINITATNVTNTIHITAIETYSIVKILLSIL